MTTTPLTLQSAGQHQATAAAEPYLIDAIDRAIARRARSGEPFSANDVRDDWPLVTSRGLVGARVDAARKRGELRATDQRVRSTLLSTRGAWLTVWVGA